MRLLRYSGLILAAPFLAVAVACPAADDTATSDGTTAVLPMTSSTTAVQDESSSGTTEEPSDDTTSTGGSSGSGGSDTMADSTTAGQNMGQQCGNGVIEGTEECDCGIDPETMMPLPCSPAGLGGAMCAGQVNPLNPDLHYTGGILDCNPASCKFKFTTCSFCGDGIFNPMGEVCELEEEFQPDVSCQDLGMGTSLDPLPCGNDCQIDTTCCEVPLPKECM